MKYANQRKVNDNYEEHINKSRYTGIQAAPFTIHNTGLKKQVKRQGAPMFSRSNGNMYVAWGDVYEALKHYAPGHTSKNPTALERSNRIEQTSKYLILENNGGDAPLIVEKDDIKKTRKRKFYRYDPDLATAKHSPQFYFDEIGRFPNSAIRHHNTSNASLPDTVFTNNGEAIGDIVSHSQAELDDERIDSVLAAARI